MADSTTTNLLLTKPEVGASTDSWGNKVNADLDLVDALFAAAGTGTSVGLNVGAGKVLTIGGIASYAAGSAAAPTITTTGDTNTGIFFPAADTIAFAEGGAEAMRIDSSGNVGIGTSSPSQKFDVVGSAQISFDGGNTYQYFQSTNNYVGRDTSGDFWMNVSGGQVLKFGIAGTERVRIDSSGNVLVGKTTTANTTAGVTLGTNPNFIASTASPSDGPYIQIGNVAATVASGFRFISWRVGASATECGSISTNGSTTTAYNTSSDYRLKNAIAPMTGALDKVALLKPVTYKWNVDGSDGQGFIAHELQEVVPGCVTGEKDAVDAEGNPQHQGIDTSFLVATLTAAIKEQQALITSLTARIAALEA